ncbi:MAG: hypothetical protein ACTS85_01110 [Arsenophonus sp. NC-PG7-MAG3]
MATGWVFIRLCKTKKPIANTQRFLRDLNEASSIATRTYENGKKKLQTIF